MNAFVCVSVSIRTTDPELGGCFRRDSLGVEKCFRFALSQKLLFRVPTTARLNHISTLRFYVRHPEVKGERGKEKEREKKRDDAAWSTKSFD